MDGNIPGINDGNFHLTLLDQIPAAVFRCKCDAERSLRFVDDAIEEISGYAPDVLVNNSQRSFASLIHHDDIAAVVGKLGHKHATEGRYDIDYRIVTADGQIRWLTERGRVCEDGGTVCVDGILIDNTERKQSELALRNSEAFYRELTYLSSEWQWVQDANFFFTWFSVNKDKLYHDKDRLVGLPRWSLRIHPVSNEAMAQHRLVCEAHLPFRDFEYAIMDDGGMPVWYSTSGNPVFAEDGSFQGYRGVASTCSIDARKRAEFAELSSSHEQLQQKMGELVRADALMQTIIDNLPCGITVLNADLKLVFLNNEFKRLLDFPEQQLASDLVSYEALARFNALRGEYGDVDVEEVVKTMIERARRFEPHRFERVRPSGTTLDIQGVPLPDGGFVTIYSDITERKQAELQLQQSEQRFRDIFESSPDPCWLIDGGVFVDCNRAAVEILGYASREALQNVHPSKLSPPKQADGENSFVKAERMMSLVQETGIHRFEWVHTRADGSNFDAEVTLSTIRLQDRKVIYCAWRDITDRKRAEEGLRRSETLLRTLYDSTSDAVMLLTGKVFFGCNRATLQMFGCSSEEAFCKKHTADLSPPKQPCGTDSVTLAKQHINIAMRVGSHRFEWIYRRADDKRDFPTEVLLNLMELDGKPVLQSVVRDITERKNAEYLLRKSEQDFRTLAEETLQQTSSELQATAQELDVIFRSVSVGITFLQDRRLVRANKAFLEMLGYEASAVNGQSTRIYYPSDEAYEALTDAYVALASGWPVFSVEVMMRRADGTEMLCAHSGALVDPDEPSKGSIWTYQDITEQRASKEKLAQTLQELEAVLDNAWIGVFVTSGERKIVRMNPYGERIFQCPPGGYIGESTRSLLSSDEDYDAFTKKARASAISSVSIEHPFCRKDGSSFLAKSVGSLLDPADPGKGAIWLVTDVTEQRAAEEKLAQTLKEMEIIFENASIGIVYLVNRRFMRLNKTFETISGYPAAELLGESTRKVYVSDEVYESFAPIYAALAAGQSVVRVDAALCKSDGSEVICELTGSLVDSRDPSKGSIWLYQDISEQRAAEEKLTQALGELDLIFNNANVGIAFLLDRRFVRVNRTFEKMIGLPVAELIGNTARRLYASDEAYEAVDKAIQAHPADESIIRLDLEMRRADGSDILVEGVCSRVDSSDSGKGVIWLFTDVTALRLVQAALQSARDDALAKNVLIEQQHQLVAHTLDQVATLLNNSGQGFLSFGRDLLVEEGFSQECQRIFERDVLDQSLSELLCANNAGQRSFVEKTLHLILDSSADSLRRDAYLGLLPAEYRLGERDCKAEYRLLDDERMMLILTDVTDEKRLKERLAHERLRVEFVVHALESRDDLLEMLRDFETFRSRVLPDLLSFERQPQTLLTEVFRHIHTFKSLFAQASLPTIPDVMHDLESRLGRLRDLGEALDKNAIKRELGTTDLGAALETDLALLREKLGDDFFNSEREVRVPASKLVSLEAEASALYGSDSRMLGLIRYLRYVPLQSLIEPHFKAAEQLAERQEKLLAPIACTGEATPVDPDIYGPFCKSLVHLFRNAVDHGIEDADTRLMAEKDETAAIRCEVRTQGEHLILTIADDGCGIDVAQIREKAIEQGKLSATESASMSDTEALMLVFADGVTTSESITTISGRGVGLGAVRQELMQLGGTVRVESVAGRGSRFTFTLPYALPVVAKAPSTGYAAARKFLAPLPEIAKTFCKTHLKLEVTVDETLHEFTVDKLFDFTAVLSLGDRLNASIGLSIERPLLLEMTRRFEPDFPEDEIEELADSVGAEIANTLVGNATVYFTHLARHVAMGTPDIVSHEERAVKIGTRAFRGFKGSGDAGSFMIFCLLTEEHHA